MWLPVDNSNWCDKLYLLKFINDGGRQNVFAFLLTLLILCAVVIMIIVLLQAGKGGGLAAMGGGMGTETFIGGRQAATLLVRSTWVAGGIFLGLAFVLSIYSSRQRQPEPILRGEFQEAPQPIAPTPDLPAPGAQPPGAPDAPTEPPGAVPPIPDGG